MFLLRSACGSLYLYIIAPQARFFVPFSRTQFGFQIGDGGSDFWILAYNYKSVTLKFTTKMTKRHIVAGNLRIQDSQSF